jgi:hypothetical protein
MNRRERSKKPTSKGGAGQKQKTQKPQEAQAEPERKAEATDEEYMALIANLPSFPWLLLRITEETSDIAGEDKKAQACDRRLREVVKQIAKWDAKATRSEEGKNIRARHFLAKVRDDSVTERIALSIQGVDLVDRRMAASGLTADSLERLAIALLIELKQFLLAQHVAGLFPDEQRDLAGALLLALSDYQRGQQMRAASEKKRELTAEERDELIERFESTLKHLPVIVYELWPDEFKDCAFSNLDAPERLYQDAIRLYLKKWARLHGRRAALPANIDSSIVKEVMKDLDVPASEYHTFRQGLRRELKRLDIERQKRKKAKSKKRN